MAKTISAIREIVRQMLRDEFQAEEDMAFEDDEIDLHIGNVLTDISMRSAYEVKETLTIANKSGTATATTASHLIDTTNLQFVAGDVGKTVYNSTDGTTAKVTAYTSTSDITLDTDIMVSGESYYIYCEDGATGRDLNISAITNLLNVDKAEYPTRQNPQEFVNFSVFGDILTLDVDTDPTDGDEVFLYCHKVHTLTESSSSLTPDLEKVLIDGVVAKSALAWLNEMRSQIVPSSARWYHTWVSQQLAIYQAGLNAITKSKAWKY
jgi:hypothetical protein